MMNRLSALSIHLGGSIHDIEYQATLNHAHRGSGAGDERHRESGLLVVGLLSARHLLLPAVLLSPVLPDTMRLRDIAMQLSQRRLFNR